VNDSIALQSARVVVALGASLFAAAVTGIDPARVSTDYLQAYEALLPISYETKLALYD
jgi:hypothetical protein